METDEKAPEFTLNDGDGNDWTLSDHLGKVVVLLFYPGDDTPVCTKQLCSVRDNWEAYESSGAVVVGISTDSAKSHKAFADKYRFPFTLLSDEDGRVVKLYGAGSWIPGRSARAVVVIDAEGIIRSQKVQPLSLFRPSDEDVLKAISNAKAG